MKHSVTLSLTFVLVACSQMESLALEKLPQLKFLSLKCNRLTDVKGL